MKALFASVCLFLLLTACQMQPFSLQTTAVDPVLVIRGGTSFGECLGYCWNEIQINPQQTRLVRQFHAPGPQAPDLLYQRPTDPDVWEQLADLIDFDRLQTYENVYGCPDCTDGGAEWIEVETTSGSKKITFEHGATVEGLETLIETVRRLREEYLEEVQQ